MGTGDGSGTGRGGRGDGDQPLALVGIEQPSYPPGARSRREEGRVVLAITVGADGRASSVEVLRSSGSNELDAAAVLSGYRARFRPARRGGAPVASRKSVSILFRLDR